MGSCSDLEPTPPPVPWLLQPAVHGRLKQVRGADGSVLPQPPTRVLAPRRPRHTHALMPGSFLGSPGLPMDDDGECRLWEEMTIFIVWIKYFSWPSCCLVSIFFFFFLFPILSHSFPPLSLLPSTSPSFTLKEISRRKQRLLGWQSCGRKSKAFVTPSSS